VNITVNDEPRELSVQLTVAQLLELLGIPPRGVAVEVNFQVVPRVRHSEHLLNDGDKLEIVKLVGGG
jgi:sulfur carrier protein